MVTALPEISQTNHKKSDGTTPDGQSALQVRAGLLETVSGWESRANGVKPQLGSTQKQVQGPAGNEAATQLADSPHRPMQMTQHNQLLMPLNRHQAIRPSEMAHVEAKAVRGKGRKRQHHQQKQNVQQIEKEGEQRTKEGPQKQIKVENRRS